jgi:hypothetical protein
MSTRMQVKDLWSSWFGKLLIVSLLFSGIAGCTQIGPQDAAEDTPTLPATPLPTATTEVTVPSGWETYTSQRCEYTISYPVEMQVTHNGPYSRTLGFELPNPDEGARNFVYVSVISPDLQVNPDEGAYNYDPVEAEILLNMQVGESKSLRNDPTTDPFFTYTRSPDATIDGQPAKKFENAQPWEFPPGTKEIRYYLQVNNCTYLIGGYMDTTGSTLPGAITEDLFNQIVSTFRVIQ